MNRQTTFQGAGTIFVLAIASACQAGVFVQMGDHPNSDVQLTTPSYANAPVTLTALNREFPQYNYTEQGDLIGYFSFNPARLVIWVPRISGHLSERPATGELVEFTAQVLDSRPALPLVQSLTFMPFVTLREEARDLRSGSVTLVQDLLTLVSTPQAGNSETPHPPAVVAPPPENVLVHGGPLSAAILLADVTAEAAPVPEPSFQILFAITVVLIAVGLRRRRAQA